MTERGIPTEGAPACPFVAFEDDRDGRSTAPDHRHRCFAEPRPAPRALAHQEAYCLSSAFPVCPTFQDWARREAAAARPTPPVPVVPRDETPPPQGQGKPPLEGDPYGTQSGDAVASAAIPPRRSQQRDWAAPPPWAGDEPLDADPAAAAAAFAGAAVSSAARVDDAPVYPPRDAVRDPQGWGSEANGLAGSAAHRLAGPDPDEPAPARPGRVTDDLDDEWVTGGAAAGAYVAGSATARPPAASRDVPPARASNPAPRQATAKPSAHDTRPPAVDQASRAPQQDAQELFGPAWERPRRYEAYPTLRTRMGLPGLGRVPRIAVWGGVLLVAALVLFMFGPSLLGLGSKDTGGAASPTPGASAEPSASVAPTTPAAATPQVYVVARNDTMSKIAKKFGVTVAAIMAANPQIKNPNKIAIGDRITIPVPVGDGTGGASPSRGTVRGASPTP